MTKTTGISHALLPHPNPGGGFIIITAIVYEDGRVIEQVGSGQDWTQIKDPDYTAKEVGKCKDCGEMVYDDDEYLYSMDGAKPNEYKWVKHELEEDCIKKEKPFKTKCGTCGQELLTNQKYDFLDNGSLVHRFANECGQ